MQVSLKALLATVLLAGFASAATADDALLKQAAQLIAAHKNAEAYSLLKPELESRAGEPDYDYLLGVAALDSGIGPDHRVFCPGSSTHSRTIQGRAPNWPVLITSWVRTTPPKRNSKKSNPSIRPRASNKR